MTKHTATPWILHPRSLSGAYQITGPKEGDLRICTVTNGPNEHANAWLITAAPDLLHWLKETRHMLTSMQKTGTLTDGQVWLLEHITTTISAATWKA